ncbi:hypothetical protein ACFSM5_17100 [Lacibacterium aquatile]|uniref:Argininosuccinate lyase n=1 Tax=Lacibacterium aquatile TaxID=1168082 RepID=A0ABW5DZH9_9PROT
MQKIIAAAVLAMGFLSVSAAHAQGKQDFTLTNKTGYDISEVYVAPSASKDWEEDVMGRDVLANGEAVDISFERGQSTCKYDLKVIYSDDNSSAEWSGFDLCKVSKITILYNRNTGVTSARYE